MPDRLSDGTILELHDDKGMLLATLELRWTARREVSRDAEPCAEDSYEATLRPQPGWASSDVCRLLAAAWEAANDGAFAVHDQLQDALRSKLSLRLADSEQALEFVTLDADESLVVLVLPGDLELRGRESDEAQR